MITAVFRGLSGNSLSRKLFSRFKSDSFARRYGNFRSGSRIPANSAFARFYDEDAEPPEFNAFTFGEGVFHCIEQRIDNLFGLLSRNTGFISDLVDDI